MKTVKILAFSVAFAALAGCDSTEMVTYEARSGEAFFETDFYSEFLETGGEHTCTVSVARGNAGGQVSVPVNFSVDNESLASAFDAPSTVEFADGELYADYTFSYDATGLAPGESVVATVSLADTDLPYSTTCSTFCFNYQFIVSAGYLADWADDTFVIENML